MRVLVCLENVFSEIGGGQSFYADLMRRNSEHQFWYFSTEPSAEKNVPINVSVIDLLSIYRNHLGEVNGTGFLVCGISAELKKHDLLLMLDRAASVPDVAFDIVDIPDFVAFGAVFPAGLRLLGVKFDHVAVSLHGTLSSGLSDNWADILPPVEIDQLRQLEDILFTGADIRYAISKRYLGEREAATGAKGQVLDLTSLIPFQTFKTLRAKAAASRALRERTLTSPSGIKNPPALAFVGRQEKWKGPDLFVDLVSSLPTASFSEALLVGPETHLGAVRSGDKLARMAQYRSVDLQRQTLSRQELWSTLANSRWVIVIPSRRDTFNLAALESILSGAPTLVSTMAGVCDFLDEVFPGLPFRRMDPTDLGAAKPQILHMLHNFEAEREAITKYLDNHQPRSSGLTIEQIYAGKDQEPADGRLYTTFETVLDHLERSVSALSRKQLRQRLNERLRDMFADQVDENEALETVRYFTHIFEVACELRNYESRLAAETADQDFLSDEQMDKVWKDLEPYCYSANRIAVYRVLAKLEKARGNALLYATYQVRCMRLAGRSHPAILKEVAQILRDHNFPDEAAALHWMYGPNFDYAAARTYLDGAPARFQRVPTGDIEQVLDERTLHQPKISLIVSLYKAAGKLPAFFAGLAHLTETTRSMMEIVLVDSFSPDDTPQVVRQLIAQHRAAGWRVSVNYIRTSVRETIQRAWNRGIGAAKGDYLSFLGVDEMNRPDAFDIMAEYLDNHPGVDWVQGTALVTDVNEAGSFVRDVMLYDRQFDHDFMNLFDTCYIGYVGALYRKAIHDRIGYYDDRFRGAGDSEFKNRALPKIVAVTLPICLGFFLNYPEERTTQSPMAEIEDIRAWYLFRTSAGIGYIFEDATDSELERVFRRCMDYRKSYLTSHSTDVELATSIADYVELSGHELHRKIFAQGAAIRTIRDMYRILDSASEILPQFSGARFIDELEAVIERAAFNISALARDITFTGCPAPLVFRNDNRSQQHHYIWRSTTQKDVGGQALVVAARSGTPMRRQPIIALKSKLIAGDMASDPSLQALLDAQTQSGRRKPLANHDVLPLLGAPTTLQEDGVAFVASWGLTVDIEATFANATEAESAVCLLDGEAALSVASNGGARRWQAMGRSAPPAHGGWRRSLRFSRPERAALVPTATVLTFHLIAGQDRATAAEFVSFSGTHPTDSQDGAKWVWTGPERHSTLRIPLALTSPGELRIGMVNFGANSKPADLRLVLNGAELSYTTYKNDGETVLCAAFESDPEGLGSTELDVMVAHHFTPAGDPRNLGVAIGYLDFRFQL